MKPLSEFYKHPKMADGHLGKCKECTKSDVRKHRADNESVREYDRSRGCRQGKEYLRNYREKNPEKQSAHNAVSKALKSGKLVRPNNCSECGKDCKPHGHHDDYSKKLSVRWLCARCHRIFHAIHGEF